ncbi:MAG: nucleotidyltransferase domain-containing protein [Bacteroidetes bacterium]|nr:nucleotidyltransferase domain-containing protein [Bacteroidota bacterium]
MNRKEKSLGDLLYALGERAKELNCLYHVEEVLAQQDVTFDEIFDGVLAAIPPGLQFPDISRARIHYGGKSYSSPDFVETPWCMASNIVIQDKVEGTIEVFYTREVGPADEGPFLKEERKLINTIAERLGHHILHHRLRNVFSEWQSLKQQLAEKKREEWKIILQMIRRTDQNLYTRISRKMLNRLCWAGIKTACALMQRFSERNDDDVFGESNRPRQREQLHTFIAQSDEIFLIAAEHLSEEEILYLIQKWIKDDKASFLVNTVENLDTSLAEIVDAISRYYHIFPEGIDLSPSTEKGLRVSLIRRFFTEQLPYINIAKDYLGVHDFFDLTKRIIFHQKSHGKLGGKSSGLFLAWHIIKQETEHSGRFQNVRIPRTWYITSDGILNFIHYNNLEEVFNQKYLDIEQIREEYPSIIQVFKNSYFSPESIKGLSVALDDFGDHPLIVRSSSLLEDSMNAAFSGKYKSLFLANAGTKAQRLAALLDAIAEVYASTFGPDPIEYRAERGLLDFHEEMGIMIQEVVGVRVGRYLMPTWSGVAFSNNEFRWSPRIKREDGLIRLVPGLGTRAVDRIGDDYPVLLAPGQPSLRVNITPDEIVRYSPKRIDVINLEKQTFETVDILDLLRDVGNDYPGINTIVSQYDGDTIRQPFGFDLDFERDIYAVTFNGLIANTDFVKEIHEMLALFQERLGTPVDVEFASDGKHLYLLQCRPQSFTQENIPSPIPQDIPRERKIFTANRYISNGRLPDITHIVYVDPQRYSDLHERIDLVTVGRIVGKLNKLLPKRQFILIGPGRWGSRGDIKLGVSVTYSDINNTALLMEMAREQGGYLPDLSFGTHFFQDLVEASIRYLPIYPDDDRVLFNEAFITHNKNMLPELLPDYASYADTVYVVDVPKSTDGKVLRVLMNAELEQAVGYLDDPSTAAPQVKAVPAPTQRMNDDHWEWRMRMAERIAADLDPVLYGVKALYLFGSTKNGTAGPASDIDLLVHIDCTPSQKSCLESWFRGWGMSLAEVNFLRTGYKVDNLIDIHYVTDEDIAKRSSFAAKIDAVTDAARLLRAAEPTP